MSRAAIFAMIATIGCSSKTDKPPTPCAKYAALKVSCAQFARTIAFETEACEDLSKIAESEIDLTARSDVQLIPRIREARHGASCAMTVTDCAALEACMLAAAEHDPPLPPMPEEHPLP